MNQRRIIQNYILRNCNNILYRVDVIATRKFSNNNNVNHIKNATIWDKYNKALERYPLLTKSITSGVLSFTADILCQVGLQSPKSIDNNDDNNNEKNISKYTVNFNGIIFDFHRLGKFTILGTFLVGPMLHYWYGFLMTRIPGTTMIATLKRLFLDQSCFAPVFLTSFFSSALVLDGKSDQIVNKLKSDLGSTIIANYSVWVPAMFLNFRFISPQYQVLFSNFIGFFWNIYLSHATFK